MTRRIRFSLALLVTGIGGLVAVPSASARPVHKKALADHFGPFLPKQLNDCRTCHLPDRPGATDVDDKPHNPFGARLAAVRHELKAAGKRTDLASRLDAVADEDSDGDGIPNLIELLAGQFPGDASGRPTEAGLAGARQKLPAYRKFRASYPWRPFEVVKRPAAPAVKNTAWVRNPVDAFIAAMHEERGLQPRPEAPRHVLLRRVYLDLIGLPPTPEELQAFQEDRTPEAYEKVVDRLLDSPRYGERWGRHWMDVWRYSDRFGVGSNLLSAEHIWRWRDWIIESLNHDKGYDRMIVEMLAGDELAPDDPQVLRATGFLGRNHDRFYREKWLQDTVEHTGKAFLGITFNCARCHDHKYDAEITQQDYYRVQAIFEPYQIRVDHIPGQPDPLQDGIGRVYDAKPQAQTFLLIRGDLRTPAKTPTEPGVPEAIGGRFPALAPIVLPPAAYAPEKRDFVVRQTIAVSEAAVAKARETLADSRRGATSAAMHLLLQQALSQIVAMATVQQALESLELAASDVPLAKSRHAALLATLRAEQLEDAGHKDADDGKQAALAANRAQRTQTVLQARRNLLAARQARAPLAKNGEAAEKALAKAEADEKLPPMATYTKRPIKDYPRVSSGRRLAFARWIADRENPLTARVAVNHVWLRHFGQPIAPRSFDLGRNSPVPTHPALLDWLAAEFMDPTTLPSPIGGGNARGWKMKPLHRLLVTSSTYRMASTPDDAGLARDRDNKYYWRMPSRRLEAEVVRDALFHLAGKLDLTMGGPEINDAHGLTTPRRSIYFRHTDESQMAFLSIFDGASARECYQRTESFVPQQALALFNSELTRTQATAVAQALAAKVGAEPTAFASAAYQRVLCRPATAAEQEVCTAFLRRAGTDPTAAARACESLIHGLMSHYEFLTAR